jgi:hypothetical protein
MPYGWRTDKAENSHAAHRWTKLFDFEWIQLA